ncbi:MAG TPA: hypothetical protein VJ600_02810 [Holophagaceae bacterium]|nr:hypothetical protein [Holophagaceae bacterium]
MHPIVERFIAGQLPEPMMAALVTGGLPVPPKDFLQAQAHAVVAGTPLAERALESFRTIPMAVLQGVLLEPIQPPTPLLLILRERKELELLEAALLHPDLTSGIVENAVPFLPGSALEIVLNNQTFWIERPVILDWLEEHPEGDYNLKRRINEFRFDVLKQVPEEVKKERIEILDQVQAGKLDRAWSELPLPKEDTEEIKQAYVEPPKGVEEEEGEEGPSKQLMKDFEAADEAMSLTKRVMKLRTNQKIMLAIKGGKEERTILIRESNRLIQVNVIRNARITEAEVAYISQMRTVNEEVLRIISMNREWMKKYPIVKSLVCNPRTPLPVAMTHLKRINEFDMKLMQRDKNIPEVLRREAKRLMEAKKEGKG